MFKESIKQYIIEKGFKRGDFILSSGEKSKYYFDIKTCLSDFDFIQEVVFEMQQILLGRNVEFDAICGIENGSLGLGQVLAFSFEKPFIYVRKEKKEYGIRNEVVGDLMGLDNVILIEDVTTTGKSVLKAIEAITDNYLDVSACCTIVNRLKEFDEIDKVFFIDNWLNRNTFYSLFESKEFLNEEKN